MNKFKMFFVPLLMFVVLTNCGDGSFDYDVTDAQRGPKFLQTSFSVSVPLEGITLEVPIQFAALSSSARDYNLEVVSNTGEDSEFSLVSATIPANELNGVAVVSFDFDDITGDDGVSKVVKLKMANPEGAPSNEVTITYFREVICNDLTLTITSDVWADETYFTLKDSEGNAIVDRFFPFGGPSLTPQVYTVDFFLEDGTYTLEIGDTFGDGMVGSAAGVTLEGSYSLTCSIITHASGTGDFAFSVPDPFPGAPNAIVEVTTFTVNP